MEKDSIDLNGKRILVTGAAGFIGSFLVKKLLTETKDAVIVGLDNLSDYNPTRLKEWRLDRLSSASDRSSSEWRFIRADISDKDVLSSVFEDYEFEVVVNLAAQAGVRYSLINPDVYISTNITGFFNILEVCRKDKELLHLVYASSSSVYGGNKKVPFSVEDKTDKPVSLYAATKKSNELLAHSYSKVFNIPVTGLRFFTVYGPAGRTDMFYYSAAEKLKAGENIRIFNYGDCKRDFTYIDDIVEGVYRVMQGAPKKAIGADGLPIPPYAIYNIGGGTPENLMDFVNVLQEELVRAGVLPEDYDFEAHRELVPMQPGDVAVTCADSSALEEDYGFRPSVDIRTGLRSFAEWYKEYSG